MRATKKSGNQAITTVAARQNFSELINRVAYGFRNFENYRQRVKVLCS